MVAGETTKAAFERASKIPLELTGEDSPEVEADFIERLWLLGLTLVLIIASGETLVEMGRRLKIVRPKKPFRCTDGVLVAELFGTRLPIANSRCRCRIPSASALEKGSPQITATWSKAIFAKNHLGSALPYWQSSMITVPWGPVPALLATHSEVSNHEA